MSKYESFEWVKIPSDLPRENLVMVIAKTTRTTLHPEDPEYNIRIFKPEELREAARSLAQRPVGVCHGPIIEGAFTVDANWNEKEQAVEALLFLPTPWMNRVRNKEIKKVSVEFTWRNEIRTPNGVEFEGFVFNRVDLLAGMNPGDSATLIQPVLMEGKRGLMEGIIQQDNIQDSIDNHSLSFFKEACEAADSFMQTLGEPFAGFKDFGACTAWVRKNRPNVKNPDAYCGYIKHKVEDPKKKKEGEDIAVINDNSQLIPMPKEKLGPDGKLVFNEVSKDSIKEIPEPQIPEKPVSPMASEPSPMTPTPIPQQQEPEVGVTSVGAIAGRDGKGPLGREPEPDNPDKNLSMPPAPASPGPHDSIKGEDSMIGDKDKVKIGEQPQVGIGTPLVESASDTPPVEPKPEPKPVDKPIEPIKPVEPPKLDAKDVRIVELEGVVNTLQEKVKTVESDKTKAVKEAVESAKKEVIEKIKKVLPSEEIVSNFNRGGRVLANDIRKVIYEASKDDSGTEK